MRRRPPAAAASAPAFPQVLGHPRPLWMLFMTEFWERFAFYGMRWALTLYIVAQFFGGDRVGPGATPAAPTARIWRWCTPTAIFGGYVADRLIGYQRSILLGAVIMAAGLFMITMPNQQVFMLGLATDHRRQRPVQAEHLHHGRPALRARRRAPRLAASRSSTWASTSARFVAPLLTGWLASRSSAPPSMPNYKVVFIATGIGMLISLVWFWFGRRQLGGIGRPPADRDGRKRMLVRASSACVVAVPVVYLLLAKVGASMLQWLLTALFVGLSRDAAGRRHPRRHGRSATRSIAMLIMFVFNMLFWMLLRAGRQLVQLPRREHRRPQSSAAGTSRSAGSSRSTRSRSSLLAPMVALAVGRAGKRHEPVDPAQVRPRPDLQRPRASCC